MRTRLLQLFAVIGMGVLALTMDSPTLSAEKSCGGGRVICTSECPQHPDLLCQAYGCAGAGASCTYSSCSSFDYTVRCAAGQ